MIVTGASRKFRVLTEAAQPGFVFKTSEEGRAAEVTLEVIRRYERKLGDVEALREQDVQQQIADEVRELMRPVQGTLEGIVEEPRIEKIVQRRCRDGRRPNDIHSADRRPAQAAGDVHLRGFRP